MKHKKSGKNKKSATNSAKTLPPPPANRHDRSETAEKEETIGKQIYDYVMSLIK